jgi:hypothetical protein
VAQPPLPLQEFFPLQPLSLVLQPPWPLQSFLPLQLCFAVSAKESVVAESWPAMLLVALTTVAVELVTVSEPVVTGAAFSLAVVPPIRPVTAAVSIKFFRFLFT